MTDKNLTEIEKGWSKQQPTKQSSIEASKLRKAKTKLQWRREKQQQKMKKQWISWKKSGFTFCGDERLKENELADQNEIEYEDGEEQSPGIHGEANRIEHLGSSSSLTLSVLIELLCHSHSKRKEPPIAVLFTRIRTRRRRLFDLFFFTETW